MTEKRHKKNILILLLGILVITFAAFGTFVFHNTERTCTVYLVRHAQTTANTEGIVQGKKGNASLSDYGIQQADNLGDHLRNISFSKVYTSDLNRTRETAQIILSKNEYGFQKTDIQENLDLDDVDWGQYEGWTIAQLQTQFGQDFLPVIFGDGQKNDALSDDVESRYHFIHRFDAAMNDIVKGCAVKATSGKQANILVVAHSSAGWWLKSRFPDLDGDSLENGSVTILRYSTKAGWKLIDYNDLKYRE